MKINTNYNPSELKEKFAFVNNDEAWTGQWDMTKVIKELFFEDNFDFMDVVPAVKDIVNLPVLDTSGSYRINSGMCDFSASDTEIDSKEYRVMKFKQDRSICGDDVRKSYLAAKARAGAWEIVDGETESLIIQQMIDQGKEAISYAVFDRTNEHGLVYELLADEDVAKFETAGTYSEPTDVLADLEKAYSELKCSVNKLDDLVYMVADDIYRLVRISASLNTEQTRVTFENGVLRYLGIEVYSYCGMDAGDIILGRKLNFAKFVDLESDQDIVKVDDKTKELENKWRASILFSTNIGYYRSDEVVYGTLDLS